MNSMWVVAALFAAIAVWVVIRAFFHVREMVRRGEAEHREAQRQELTRRENIRRDLERRMREREESRAEHEFPDYGGRYPNAIEDTAPAVLSMEPELEQIKKRATRSG